MLSLLSRHGCAVPMVRLTVDKANLKSQRNGYEYQALVRLAEVSPAEVHVRIGADRGFGEQKHCRVLTNGSKFDDVIRFRGDNAVKTTGGQTRPAVTRMEPGGRHRGCMAHRPW